MTVQSRNALAEANKIRLGGADLRGELKSLPRIESLCRAAELLDSPPEPIQRMRVDRLLTAVRYIGPDKARRLCDDLQISPLRYVGPETCVLHGHRPLSERQRVVLAARLRWMASRTDHPLSRAYEAPNGLEGGI